MNGMRAFEGNPPKGTAEHRERVEARARDIQIIRQWRNLVALRTIKDGPTLVGNPPKGTAERRALARKRARNIRAIRIERDLEA